MSGEIKPVNSGKASKRRTKSKKKKKRKSKEAIAVPDAVNASGTLEEIKTAVGDESVVNEPAAQKTASETTNISSEDEADVFNFEEEPQEKEIGDDREADRKDYGNRVVDLSLGTFQMWRLEEVDRITDETTANEFEKIVRVADQAFADKNVFIPVF